MEVSETLSDNLGLSALAWFICDSQNLNGLENLPTLAKVKGRKYQYYIRKNESETAKFNFDANCEETS